MRTPFVRAALLLAIAVGLATLLRAQDFDLVIANGRVLDPESGLDAVRSIGINGRKIVAISGDRLTGRAIIDAAGLVVAPGFIDLHAHGQTAETYRYQARDGVTTAFELEVGTADVDEWYAERKTGRLINYGVSIGHIPVRMAVLGDPGKFLPTGDGAHRAASPAEIKEIAQRIADGLKKGAVSIGAGFPYTPAANQEELLEVFRIAGRDHVPVHVHIRRGVAGLDEALKLAAQTNASLHVVHINSTGVAATRELLEMVTNARKRGMDVTTEAYPYAAGMTEIQSANLDEYQNAPEERLALLEWPRTGERLNRETFQKYRKIGGPVVLHTNTDEMVAVAVNSPLTMIASDAYWENGTGHPRTTGTYSKVLGCYVREARSLTLMDAIRKMTLMPAQRLQERVPAMQAKGRLRVGADADITIFDAGRIIDRSTYREPGVPPVGIQHVIVNGVPIVVNGQLVEGVAPGLAVRAPYGSDLGASSQQAVDEQMIREARARSNKAIAAHDLVGISRVWMADVHVVSSTSVQATGRESNQQRLARQFTNRPDTIYVRRPTVIEVYPSWAVASERGEWTGRWTEPDGALEIGGTYLVQWRKVDGQWLIQGELYVPTRCSGGKYCLQRP